MSKALSKAQFSKALAVNLLAGAALAVASTPVRAADPVQPPPYVVAGMSGVSLTVVWDEAAIRKALPHGIQPVKEMTGGINIYSAERGYVIGPYSAAYFYVDIEGFDSPEGIKGRWMLAGAYGPENKTSAALKEYFGLPVRPGTSQIQTTADGKRAIGTVNGHDFITADFKPVPGPCQAGNALLNYVALAPQAEQPQIAHIPFVGDSCKAEPVSAKITAPAGDPFAAFSIAKLTGASEFKNASGAFAPPQPAK